MLDKAAERRRKCRERVVKVYKEAYCEPFLKAKRDGADNISELATRSLDFRRGVEMVDPNGHWYRRFNDAWFECCDDLGVE